MKTIIIYSDRTLNLLGWFMKIKGITLWPFIILRERLNTPRYKNLHSTKRTINHESIHIKQQQELLLIPFYVLYVFFYLWNIVKYGFDTKEAYYNIPFEKEAFKHDDDFNYLENRSLYSWVKFIYIKE